MTRKTIKCGNRALQLHCNDQIDALNKLHLPGRFNNFFICYTYARLLKDVHIIIHRPTAINEGKVGNAVVQIGAGWRRLLDSTNESSYSTASKRSGINSASYQDLLRHIHQGTDIDAAHTCGASYTLKVGNNPLLLAINELLTQSEGQTNYMPAYINNNEHLDRTLDKLQVKLLNEFMQEEYVAESNNIYSDNSMLKKIIKYREAWLEAYEKNFCKEHEGKKNISEIEQPLIDIYASFVQEPRIDYGNRKEIIKRLKESNNPELSKEQERFSGYEFIGVDENNTLSVIRECIKTVAEAVYKLAPNTNNNTTEEVLKFFEDIQNPDNWRGA